MCSLSLRQVTVLFFRFGKRSGDARKLQNTTIKGISVLLFRIQGSQLVQGVVMAEYYVIISNQFII